MSCRTSRWRRTAAPPLLSMLGGSSDAPRALHRPCRRRSHSRAISTTTANQAVQRTGASRFARRRNQRQRWLALLADLYVRHMRSALTFLASLACAGVIIFVLQRLCPERFEMVLYWPLPLFHLFFHPLASGPSPLAGFCSLVTDAFIVAGLIFLFLIWRGRR